MPVPAPMRDPSHVETRLLILAEMLERAVAEVRRISAEIKSDPRTEPDAPGAPDVD